MKWISVLSELHNLCLYTTFKVTGQCVCVGGGWGGVGAVRCVDLYNKIFQFLFILVLLFLISSIATHPITISQRWNRQEYWLWHFTAANIAVSFDDSRRHCLTSTPVNSFTALTEGLCFTPRQGEFLKGQFLELPFYFLPAQTTVWKTGGRDSLYGISDFECDCMDWREGVV